MMNLRVFLCVALIVLFSSQTVRSEDALRARNDAIIVRAIERMPDFDYSDDEHVNDAIARHLKRVAGTEEYLRLAKRFRPADLNDQLSAILTSKAGDSIKVEAANMLSRRRDGKKVLRELLVSESAEDASQAARIIGNLGNDAAIDLLASLIRQADVPYEVRKHAVTGLSKNNKGQQTILASARSKELAADTRLLAGGLLARSNNAKVRSEAASLLPQPQQKDQKPLAPIDQLAAKRGNVANGLKLFRGAGTCANCHVVNEHGKEVGPNLSEIGSKLSREAMFTSILDPSAGISHNYENYLVLTDSGQVITGLLVSQTPEMVIIRTAEAIDRKIPDEEIEQIKKSEKSIMPEQLHHAFNQQGLIDIVEYMSSLKKK